MPVSNKVHISTEMQHNRAGVSTGPQCTLLEAYETAVRNFHLVLREFLDAAYRSCTSSTELYKKKIRPLHQRASNCRDAACEARERAEADLPIYSTSSPKREAEPATVREGGEELPSYEDATGWTMESKENIHRRCKLANREMEKYGNLWHNADICFRSSHRPDFFFPLLYHAGAYNIFSLAKILSARRESHLKESREEISVRDIITFWHDLYALYKLAHDFRISRFEASERFRKEQSRGREFERAR